MKLKAEVGNDDSGQNREREISNDRRNQEFLQRARFASRYVRVQRLHNRQTRKDPTIKTFARRQKYDLAGKLSQRQCSSAYFSVTFSAVAKPLFTVAVVLTAA